MNNYECFWRGKRLSVQAETTLAARAIAAHAWKVRKQYEIAVVLADKPISTGAI